MSRSGVVRCLLAAVLFGASAPAASELADDMPALVLAGLLYLGAGAAMAPAAITARPTAVALRREWRPTVVAIVAGGAVGPALLVAGLARTSAATASILLNLELAATVALAATVFREHLGPRLLAGAALVSVSGAVLVWEPGARLDSGALLIAGACVAWGFDNGVTARIDQLSPEHVVLLKGFVAGGTNLMLGIVVAGGDLPGTTQVLGALVIGGVGYGVSIVLWVKGARELGAARGQVIFATAPFIGAVLAWSVLGESITRAQMLAVVAAAIGVAWSIRSAHDHAHTHHVVEHEHEHRHDDGHHDHPHDEAARPTDPPADDGQPHTHVHLHWPITHGHPHVPDLHHRHH